MDEAERAYYQNAREPRGQDGRRMLSGMNVGEHARLAQWAFARHAPAADARALDIGCGGGANLLRLLALCPQGHVTGVDFSETSVALSREHVADAIDARRCTVERGDVHALALPSGSIDFACAFETVYFWQNIDEAFREVYRVLDEHGSFMVCNTADGTHERDYRMVSVIEGMHVYRPEELARSLVGAGFTLENVFRHADEGWIAFVAACT